MLNSVIIQGRLTINPEIKHTQSGKAVTSFSVAVQRNYAAQGEERETDFIKVEAWGKQAEFVSKYFNKGDMIIIEGSIRVDNYTDKDGNKRKDTKVIINNTQFCGSQRNNTQTPNIEADNEQPSEDDLPF